MKDNLPLGHLTSSKTNNTLSIVHDWK